MLPPGDSFAKQSAFARAMVKTLRDSGVNSFAECLEEVKGG